LAIAATPVVACLWAAWLYQPWRATPFYPLDFLESIGVILRHESFASRVSALFHTYTTLHGRLQGALAPYFAAQWTLFGWNTRGWQLFAFGVMCVNVFLVFRVLRRFGAAWLGASAGSFLFVVSLAVVRLWAADLLFGEPPAMVVFFSATLLAAGYSESRRWILRALGILVLSLGAALFKETAMAALPFTILVATIYRGHGRWDWPAISRRNITLVLGAFLLVVGFGLAVVLARRAAPVDDYVGHYGEGLRTLEHLLPLLEVMFLPVSGVLGATLFLGALAIGLLLRLRRSDSRRSLTLSFAVAMSLPFLGTLAYLPWYYFRPDCAAPFLLGPAAMVALSSPHRLQSRAEGVLACLWGLAMAGCFVLASRTASQTSRQMFALREVLGEVATRIVSDVQRGGASRLSFVVDTADQHATWFAPKVQQFATLIAGRPMPDPSMLPCDDAAIEVRAAEQQEHLYIALPGDCESVLRLSPPARIVKRPYSYFSLRDLSAHQDTVRAYLWPPDPAAAAPRQ
jgi:hypothetical protein